MAQSNPVLVAPPAVACTIGRVITRTAGRSLVAAVAIGAGAWGYWAVGTALVRPSRQAVREAPESLSAARVVIQSPSGAALTAWFATPQRPRAAAIILHGVRANRGDMVGRAKLLREAGFAVLVPDLQAHGESTGEQITFGYLEAKDAEACAAFLQGQLPGVPLVGIGVSMGGAAIALAGPRLPLEAAVLEAVYTSIDDAVDNRIRRRVGPLASVLAPLLLLQLQARLGIPPRALRPVASAPAMGYPTLVISGTADRETTEQQTRALYAAIRAPKELWLVAGAGHVDLLQYDPEGYRRTVLPFLERHADRG